MTWCATKRKRQNNSGFCKSKPNQQTAWKTYRKWFQMKSVNARLSEPPPTSPRIHIFSDCCQLWYYLSIHSFCTLSQLIIFSLLVLYCGIVLWYTTSTKCLYTCSKMYVLLSFPIHSLSIYFHGNVYNCSIGIADQAVLALKFCFAFHFETIIK